MGQFPYNVIIEDFATRHYIKSFEKKYHGNWDKTKQDIVDQCKRIDNMLQFSRADLIKMCGEYKLVKLDFSVEGSKASAKKSGNRCILCVNELDREVKILLVYAKTDIGSPNETQKWENVVFDNYPEIRQIFCCRVFRIKPLIQPKIC